MITFHQRSGKTFRDTELIATGWAGQREGINNPDLQNVSNIGPLPRGFYDIGPAYTHPQLGPLVMNLAPDPSNEMFGRSAFRIHGASSEHPEVSSKGCIVLPRYARQHIIITGDRRLQVIE
jgi:hypothetical protein